MDKIWVETLKRISDLERRVSRIEVPERTDPDQETVQEPDQEPVQEPVQE